MPRGTRRNENALPPTSEHCFHSLYTTTGSLFPLIFPPISTPAFDVSRILTFNYLARRGRPNLPKAIRISAGVQTKIVAIQSLVNLPLRCRLHARCSFVTIYINPVRARITPLCVDSPHAVQNKSSLTKQQPRTIDTFPPLYTRRRREV